MTDKEDELEPVIAALRKRCSESMVSLRKEYRMPNKHSGYQVVSKKIYAGNRLASVLNSAIDGMETDDLSRSDIISSMASSAGISAGSVSEILKGFDDSDPEHPVGINCPPRERLSGFATVLAGVSLSQLITAAETDGCSYSSDDSGESMSALKSKMIQANAKYI